MDHDTRNDVIEDLLNVEGYTTKEEETKELLSGLKEEVVLDLVKLRNMLHDAKKGTAVACRMVDEIIKKYDT